MDLISCNTYTFILFITTGTEIKNSVKIIDHTEAVALSREEKQYIKRNRGGPSVVKCAERYRRPRHFSRQLFQ